MVVLVCTALEEKKVAYTTNTIIFFVLIIFDAGCTKDIG